ncbi:hypothetical protein K490DRAFT_37008, partial [Saccharata proteae CBS 121410]
GRCLLHVIERDLNVKKNSYLVASYIKVLETNLETAYQPSILFMQDNAPIYKAYAVRD